MDAFWQVIISNSIVASALAAVAGIASRFRVSPAVVHVLLLLALVKLFTLPIVPIHVPISAAPGGSAALTGDRDSASLWAAIPGSDRASRPWLGMASWQQLLIAMWIAGGVVIAVRWSVRIAGACRLLRHARPAPDFLNEMAKKHCEQLGIMRCPTILTLPIRLTPAVWSLGGYPRIIFPAALIGEMDRERLETLLAHELAHIRRKDHLVRLLELIATIVFWWHPIVWWAKAQLREMEERACDALVLRMVCHGERAYATALVETLEFLNRESMPLSALATAASPVVSLERRLAMMKHGSHRTATFGAVLFGMAFCLSALALALAAEPPQDRDRERESERRVLLLRERAEQTDGTVRRLIIRTPENENGERKVIFRDLENEGGERVLFLLDPESEDDERVAILRDPQNAGGEGRVIIRDRDDEVGERRLIIRNPDNEGARRRVIIRRAAPED